MNDLDKYRYMALWERLLVPNQGVEKLIDNWSFSMPLETVVIGRPRRIQVCAQPIIDCKPHHLVMNVPEEGLFFLSSMVHRNLMILDGQHDCCVYGSFKQREKGAVCSNCGAPPKGGLEELICRHCQTAFPVGSKDYGKPITCGIVKTCETVSFDITYAGRKPKNYQCGEEFFLSIQLICSRKQGIHE